MWAFNEAAGDAGYDERHQRDADKQGTGRQQKGPVAEKGLSHQHQHQHQWHQEEAVEARDSKTEKGKSSPVGDAVVTEPALPFLAQQGGEDTATFRACEDDDNDNKEDDENEKRAAQMQAENGITLESTRAGLNGIARPVSDTDANQLPGQDREKTGQSTTKDIGQEGVEAAAAAAGEKEQEDGEEEADKTTSEPTKEWNAEQRKWMEQAQKDLEAATTAARKSTAYAETLEAKLTDQAKQHRLQEASLEAAAAQARTACDKAIDDLLAALDVNSKVCLQLGLAKAAHETAVARVRALESAYATLRSENQDLEQHLATVSRELGRERSNAQVSEADADIAEAEVARLRKDLASALTSVKKMEKKEKEKEKEKGKGKERAGKGNSGGGDRAREDQRREIEDLRRRLRREKAARESAEAEAANAATAAEGAKSSRKNNKRRRS
ncbi:MAG: hypothetical protein M1819_003046 [Sarea resinae]|nr:MAG: hypothetical protein M1819_003046 [Sarea resinae]